MSEKPIKPESVSIRFRRNRKLPPIDEAVQPPGQVRRAAALAEARMTGKSLAPLLQPNRKVPYSDAEIDEALQYIDGGHLKVTDVRIGTIVGLAREGARHIKARRRGARQPREKSGDVTRRLEALIQAFLKLPERLKKRPTGTTTIRSLRKSVIKKLGLPDGDDVISEDTIRQDIRQIRPLLRLIQKGIIPRIGGPKRQGLSAKTQQEIEEGRRAVARAARASKAQRRSARDSKRQHNDFEK